MIYYLNDIRFELDTVTTVGTLAPDIDHLHITCSEDLIIEDFILLLSMIPRFVTNLSLKINLGQQSYDNFRRLIQSIPRHITYLDLSENNLGSLFSSVFRIFEYGLYSHDFPPCLVYLGLGNNNLGFEALRSFLCLCHQLDALKILNIGGNDFYQQNYHQIRELLQLTPRHLQTLINDPYDFSDRANKEEILEIVADFPSFFTCLYLNTGGAYWQSTDFFSLFSTLKPSIIEVFITGIFNYYEKYKNKYTQAFAAIPETVSKITFLNGAFKKGLEITKAMVAGITPKHLCLAHNQLGSFENHEIVAIIRVLSPKIWILDLSYNQLGQAIILLFSALKEGIRELILHGNDIEYLDKELLINAFNFLPSTVEWVFFDDWKINPKTFADQQYRPKSLLSSNSSIDLDDAELNEIGNELETIRLSSSRYLLFRTSTPSTDTQSLSNSAESLTSSEVQSSTYSTPDEFATQITLDSSVSSSNTSHSSTFIDKPQILSPTPHYPKNKLSQNVLKEWDKNDRHEELLRMLML